MEKVNLRTAGLTKLTDHVMVIDCENEKIVFMHGVNVGYISPEKIFYIRKDYFKGGSKSTVFTEEHIKVVEQTYQLVGSTTEERMRDIEKSAKDLNGIREAVSKEKDPVKLNALLENAASIVKEFANDPNKKRYADIEIAVNEALKAKEEKAPIIVPAPAAAAASNNDESDPLKTRKKKEGKKSPSKKGASKKSKKK